MRIGSIPNAGFEQYKINRTKQTETAKVSQNADYLEVSETSRMFSQAVQAAQNVPEVRQERVNALREEIASGTYVRNSRDIAAKILSGTMEP